MIDIVEIDYKGKIILISLIRKIKRIYKIIRQPTITEYELEQLSLKLFGDTTYKENKYNYFKTNKFSLLETINYIYDSEEVAEEIILDELKLKEIFLLIFDIEPTEFDLEFLQNKNLTKVIELMVYSDKFIQYRKELINTEDVIAFYKYLIGKPPEESIIKTMENRKITKAKMLNEIWNSPDCIELRNRFIDRLDVCNGYMYVLGRFAEEEEIEYYLGENLTISQFLKILWESDEFQLRYESLEGNSIDSVKDIYRYILGKDIDEYKAEKQFNKAEPLSHFLYKSYISKEGEEYRKSIYKLIENQGGIALKGMQYGISNFKYYDKDYCLVFDNDMHDVISNAVKQGDFIWEEEVSYIDLLPDKGFVLDIGANIGSISMLFHAKGWSGFCIDASPKNIECIKRSIILNDADFDYQCFAVTDKSGYIQFRENGPWGVIDNEIVSCDIKNSMMAFDEIKQSKSMQAFCLNDYKSTKLKNINKIDFIKMDIEGSEYVALDGMDIFLKKFGYPKILSEVNGYNLFTYNKTPKDLFKKFNVLEYIPYKLIDKYLVKVDINCIQISMFENYMFIHKSDNSLEKYTRNEILSWENINIDDIVFNIKHGWGQVKKHMIYSLKDFPELLNNKDIEDAIEETIKNTDDIALKFSAKWYEEMKNG